MYGKRRIMFTKDGKIVRAGGKSYHQIGKWSRHIGGYYRVEVLRPEHKWSRTLDEENAALWHFDTKAEARKRVLMMYSDGMGGLQ
jgi:hypothetical protein